MLRDRAGAFGLSVCGFASVGLWKEFEPVCGGFGTCGWHLCMNRTILLQLRCCSRLWRLCPQHGGVPLWLFWVEA